LFHEFGAVMTIDAMENIAPEDSDVRKLAYRRLVACGFISTKTCGN